MKQKLLKTECITYYHLSNMLLCYKCHGIEIEKWCNEDCD